MKTKLHLVSIAILSLTVLTSCNYKIVENIVKHYPEYPSTDGIKILTEQEISKLPEGAEIVGYVDLRDSGLTLRKNCTYLVGIKKITEIARKNGANYAYINNHAQPFVSTCHRFTATLYRTTK